MHKKAKPIDIGHLFIGVFVALAIGMLYSSCAKNAAVAPTSSTARLLVVDASPDLLPMQVYIGNLQLGTGHINYPTVSKYYSVFSGAQTLQLRNHYNSSVYYFTDTLINSASYSMFVVGLASASTHADTLSYIFTIDTATLPNLGYGKIRFVNASPRTTPVNVYANGTLAFSSIAYKGVSKFIQVPAGIYSFNVNPAATPASILTSVSNITIQDGRLYTVYTHGLVGRTDSAAITTAVITNQ